MERKSTFGVFAVAILVMVFLGATPVGAQCNIALVSDDDQLDNGAFLSALSGMGITYTLFNYNEPSGGGPIVYMDDPSFLASWNIIVWFQSGYSGSGRAITAAEHDAVAAWLATGGKLIVTGYDVIGSPDDPLMADLIRSSTDGDYTYGYYSDVIADHPISNGPYGNFVGMTDIESEESDNDWAVADVGRGALTVTRVNYDPSDNIAKIMVTEDPGTGMVVVFWNGNDYISDWDDPGGYPELYDMMRNMFDFICTGGAPRAAAVPTVSWFGAFLLMALLAGSGFILVMRRF